MGDFGDLKKKKKSSKKKAAFDIEAFEKEVSGFQSSLLSRSQLIVRTDRGRRERI